MGCKEQIWECRKKLSLFSQQVYFFHLSNFEFHLQVKLADDCPLSNIDMMWITHSSLEAKSWQSHYIYRMHKILSMFQTNTTYVNLADD